MTAETTQTTRKRSTPSEVTCTAGAAKKRRRREADAVPVQADCTQDAGSLQADAPRRRSRSERVRPESVEQLQSALETGRLDNRTNAAKRLVLARESLAREPQAVCRGLLLDALAANAVVLSEMLTELAKPNNLLVNGEPSPLVAKHLPEAQKALRSNIDTLLKLDGRQPPEKAADGELVDVSSILLAAAQEGRGGGPGAAGGETASLPSTDNTTNF